MIVLCLLLLQDPGQFDPKYKDFIEAAAEVVSREAVGDMISAPGGKLLVLPLAGDQGPTRSLVTDELKDAIVGTGKFGAIEATNTDKILEFLGLKGKIDQVTNLERAIELGVSYDADYVLFGRTDIDGRHPDKYVAVNLHFRIVEVKSKKGFFIGSYSYKKEAGLFSPTHLKVKIKDMSVVWRVVIWMIVMLALPFVVVAFKEAASGSRPLLPVMMVVVFTGVDIFLAFALLGFSIENVFAAGMFVMSMAISLFWNLFVLAKIAQMSEHGA